jgi:hypothetical protein
MIVRKTMKRKHYEMLSVLLACLLVVIFITPTLAHEKFLQKVRRQYNLDNKNGKCTLCHEEKKNEEPGRKNINVYGKAIQGDAAMKPLLGKPHDYAWTDKEIATVLEIVAKLDSADTDSDGASNKEELDLGTYPADAKSSPDKAALSKHRSAKKK